MPARRCSSTGPRRHRSRTSSLRGLTRTLETHPQGTLTALLQDVSLVPRLAGGDRRGRPARGTESDASDRALTVKAGCRPEATRAALIPITKSEAWWALAQDERRKVLEETSHHIAIGLEYLPAIARRLYHGHDLDEPFDFLTWFEYAPQAAPAFEDLVARLRATREWDYVEREVDIRLAR